MGWNCELWVGRLSGWQSARWLPLLAIMTSLVREMVNLHHAVGDGAELIGVPCRDDDLACVADARHYFLENIEACYIIQDK